ncbi:MAG: serine/threonine protein kinase [Rubrivivax sp.]
MTTEDAPGAGVRPLDYAALTPDHVLAALDAVSLRGDGRILQLNSYENRVFQVMLEDGQAVVAKFYRPQRWSDAQIVEEHRFALELQDAEVPVVAPLALQAAEAGLRLEPALPPRTLAIRSSAQGVVRYAVAPRRAGRAPELEDDAVLQRLGGFIGRLHAVGARRAFEHRRTMRPAEDARQALALLMDGGHVPEGQAPAWKQACEAAIERIGAAFGRVRPRTLRLHGDCHPGNLLWRETGAHVVDLDDACNGPAVQDLWMLLSGEPGAAAHQLHQLLQGYRAFCRFDERELELVAPLRLLRMIRHNAWVAQRWTDPAFPVAFPDFGTAGYWGQQTVQLRELLASADYIA